MISEPEQPKQEPQKRGISGKAIFTLTILVVLLFFVSPLPTILSSLIPESAIRNMLADVVQKITLSDQQHVLSEPRKYEGNTPLPVIGHSTGICFSFYATRKTENKSIITTKALDDAAHNKGIAEIIALGENKNEYPLKNISLIEERDDNGKPYSIICHKFGIDNSSKPDKVTTVFVRPYAPVTPHKVTWISITDIR